jgi:hypothetical protein
MDCGTEEEGADDDDESEMDEHAEAENEFEE